jgi:Leucine-rich repeat (LRR) protein
MLTSLPAELSHMTSLESLRLSNNQLKNRLDPISTLTQMKSLYLASNGISALPISFADLSQLQYLNLSKNDLKTIPSKVFASLSQLKKLDVSI